MWNGARSSSVRGERLSSRERNAKLCMTESFIRNVLFPVIRSGMGLDAPPVSVSREDFESLRHLGRMQAVLPVIWAGLMKQEVPPAWLEELQTERMECIYRHMLRDYALQKICEVFEAESIPYVPLKGAVVCDLYPEAWMRTSSDLDVLVREEDLQRAVQALEEKADFHADLRNYHDVTMTGNGLCLELHFHLKENMANLDRLLAEVWNYVNPAPEGCRYEMTPEYQLFHILSHMAYHMVKGGLGIRPFLDLWLLREKMAYSEPKLRELCAECGILKFYESSCALLAVWMTDAPHTETTRELEQYCLSGSVFGSKAFGAEQREHRGLGYLAHRLFASREVLEEMYPRLRKRPFLLPLYQMKRWTRLMNPRKRKGALSEIKRLSSVEQETVSAYDGLLRRLGL